MMGGGGEEKWIKKAQETREKTVSACEEWHDFVW
jgi:hypothetical protein